MGVRGSGACLGCLQDFRRAIRLRAFCGEQGGHMAGDLTFEQVKRARVFAWHELHYIFASDTLLRVVLPIDSDSGSNAPGHLPMELRPSSLRGTEHHLDSDWHHLENCTCQFCSPHNEQAGSAADKRGGCGRPTT
jgi:hypothetical protein